MYPKDEIENLISEFVDPKGIMISEWTKFPNNIMFIVKNLFEISINLGIIGNIIIFIYLQSLNVDEIQDIFSITSQ
jgi:hypothetical protein